MPSWAAVNAELRDLLTESEYADARASTLTAFYTPPEVVDAMLGALREHGFLGSSDVVLEPGCGTGNFIAQAEAAGDAASFTGVELDRVSSRIAAALHPQSEIVHAALEDCYVSHDSFDLAVGNVPYSDAVTVRDGETGMSQPLHDWFIAESLRAVRPGGVVAVLTSRYTMDKRSEGFRRSIAEQADLIAGVRLPSSTFHDFAGTDVVADVLVFSKKDAPEPGADPSWVHTTPLFGQDGPFVNSFFAEDSTRVVGAMRQASGPFGPTVEVGGVDGGLVGGELADKLASQLVGAGDLHEHLGERAEDPVCCVRPADPSAFEYMVDDAGRVWYGDFENVELVGLSEGDGKRLAAMVSLRDAVRDTLALEARSADDAEVARAIEALDERYDAFVADFGRVNSNANLRLWRTHDDYSIATLSSVENLDAQRRFVGKADVLSMRVQAPSAPMPERVDDVDDALSISLDRAGGVDLGLIGSLLGAGSDAETLSLLGDRVVVDPADGRAVTAEEFLSGDVRAKIARIDALIDEEENGERRRAESAWRDASGFARVMDDLRSMDASKNAVEALRDNGALEAFCDPDGASSFVDVDAALQDGRVGRYGYGAGLLVAVVDKARAGARLVEERPDGTVRPLGIWRDAVRNARAGWQALAALAYALEAGEGRIDDVDLSPVVLDAMSTDGLLAALRTILPDEEVPAVHDTYDTSERTRRAIRVAEVLRRNPAALEYLAITLHDDATSAQSRPYAYRGGLFHDVTLEGYQDYARHRAEAVPAPHVDRGRIASLERLRGRLEAALPPRLGADEISVGLGAPWVPVRHYYQFAVETFGLDAGYRTAAERRRFTVAHSEETGTWQVNYGNSGGASPDAERRFGTKERSCLDIFASALNKSSLEVTKPDPSGEKKRVKDPEATAAAWECRRKIEDEFRRWAFSDPDRAGELTAIYNERFNSLVPRSYDGSYLTLPGTNPRITLRPHQKDAVARILLSDEGTLVAHVVGAGKTFTGVAAAHEAKRLGRANKPMIVVPNHLTEQWASDFLTLYPGAKVLCMSASDTKSSDAVRMFWARAAAGDWDAVIVGQSRFDALQLSADYRARRLEARAEEFRESIALAKAAGGDSYSVKQLEKLRKRCEASAKRLRESRVEKGVTFEQVGCDFLFVDEAHGYKNLAVATSMNVAGVTGASSQKCESLLDKCEYLREHGHGANIVFATGTPVSNTMSELYNMQRYLAPDLLRSQGVAAFSSWASAFGDIVDSVEVRPEGTGFQVKQRFARFYNLPELMSSFHVFADIMTADDVDLDVPELSQRTVAIQATPEQKALIGELAERANAVRLGQVDAAVDNMLKITSEGRKLALDPKLLFPDDPDWEPMEGGKVEACCERVREVWERTAAQRGTQLVFCDTSTSASSKWNVYDDVKRRLVEMGIPAEEVAFVSDAGDSPKRREQLFERVNRGEVRVLLGSTQKLGTGTNVQERLAAIHDLDCPWRPSDLEQRLGRIVRQGNTFDEVEDYRYVTVGTFDSYLYQTVERKQHFISQVFTNKSPARAADDLDEAVLSYAQIKAIATGNPKMQRRMEVENRITQLKLLRQAHEAGRKAARLDADTKHRPEVRALEETLSYVKDDQAAFSAALDALLKDEATSSPLRVEVKGQTYTDQKEASRALYELRGAGRPGEVERVGTFYGIPIGIKQDRLIELNGDVLLVPKLVLTGAHDHVWDNRLSGSAAGAVKQLRQLLERVSGGLPKVEARLERARGALEAAEAAADEPWDGEQELASLERELAGLPLEDAAEREAQSTPEEAEDIVQGGVSAVLLPCGGAPRRISLEPSVETFQSLVGGPFSASLSYPSVVDPYVSIDVIANDEGKLGGFTPNRAFVDLEGEYGPAGELLDVVFGDCVLAAADTRTGEYVDMAPEDRERACERFRDPESGILGVLAVKSGGKLNLGELAARAASCSQAACDDAQAPARRAAI